MVESAEEIGTNGSPDLDLDTLIERKVEEAVAAALGKVEERVASNSAGLEDLRLTVRGVGALLRDCVV